MNTNMTPSEKRGQVLMEKLETLTTSIYDLQNATVTEQQFDTAREYVNRLTEFLNFKTGIIEAK